MKLLGLRGRLLDSHEIDTIYVEEFDSIYFHYIKFKNGMVISGYYHYKERLFKFYEFVEDIATLSSVCYSMVEKINETARLKR